MNSKIILMFLGLIAAICISYPVSAENGSILISNDTLQTYTIGNAAAVGTQFSTQIYFDTANYNYLSYFDFYPSWYGAGGYVRDFESTTFTITSGGTGTGIYSYDKNLSRSRWIFSSDMTITSSPLILSYTNLSVLTNFTNGARGATFGVGVNNAVCVKDTYGYCGGGQYRWVSVATRATDYYNVTYPFPGYFNVTIIKNPYLNTKYFITSATTTYSQETTFNKVNIVGALFKQLDGIYLNATLASGVYTKVLVNASGISGYVPPGEEVVPDPITGVGIGFDAVEYSIGGIANISWIRTINTPLLCTDYVRLTSPTNIKSTLVSSPPNTGYTKLPVSESGTYETSFERECFLAPTEKLATDTAVVGAETPSYIYAPAQVGVGNLFNVTYKIGWTKTLGSTVWIRDYAWDNSTGAYSSTYQSWAATGTKNVETNQSIIVTKTGKHLIKLCDVLQGCKASTTTEAYFNGSEVTTNVSQSNITLDKAVYSYGETMLVKVAVDNYNWSEKQVIIEYYDEDESLTQTQYYVQEQIESIPLYISDLTFSGSGAALMRLLGKNTTGDYILATASFSLSNVDAEGYGLSVSGDPKCIGDVGQITAIVPAGETANLSISADNAKYNKNYVINGTKIIAYKFPIAGTYYITLRVNDEAKRLIIKEIGVCVVVPTPTWAGNGTWAPTQDDIAPTCNFWDGCVRTMFMQQGVNDVTRLLFALFCIGVVMFFGMIASKGNFGVSICLGLIPYAFFAYLTISTPCGQYMPLWVTIFMALVIGIKMRWFS